MEEHSGWRCAEDGYVGLVDDEDKRFDIVLKIPRWFGYSWSYCCHASNKPGMTFITALGSIQNETILKWEK